MRAAGAATLLGTLAPWPPARAEALDVHSLEEVTVLAQPATDPVLRAITLGGLETPRRAGDGAEALRDVAGISLIRQGGAGSDPLLRGLGGTRLSVLVDGLAPTSVCNHRMDPLTSYVFPASFDSLVLLKGPQSVRYGPAVSGTVSFERTAPVFDSAGATVRGSVLGGSFERSEVAIDAAVGSPLGSLEIVANQSDGDNYRDGDGDEVFSLYDRWSAAWTGALTPDQDTRLEAFVIRSDGEAANASIHMDVISLDRTSYGLHLVRENVSGWLGRIEARAARTEVDHVMDDFSLRPRPIPDPTQPFTQTFSAMGQDVREDSGSLALTLTPDVATEAVVGLDYRSSDYTARAATGNQVYFPETPERCFFVPFPPPDGSTVCIPPVPAINVVQYPDLGSVPRDFILDLDRIGGYVELSHSPSDDTRWVGGLRFDDYGYTTGAMRLNGQLSPDLQTGANARRHQHGWSGFLRHEHSFAELPVTTYLGVGHAQRPPDYFEVYSFGGLFLDRERNTEIDAAVLYSGQRLSGHLSAFVSRITDFILTSADSTARNVDVWRLGGEAEVTVRLGEHWQASGVLAYLRGENTSDDAPLAQTPPPEARLGLRHVRERWSAGVNGRFVTRQDRVQIGFGNTLGVDIGETPGFATLGFDLRAEPWQGVRLAFAVDNVFDRSYAEHVNRAASPVAGFVPLERVNEPGRAAWVRVEVELP